MNKERGSSLYCSCGCNSGVILKYEKDGVSCLSLVSDNFYFNQQTFLGRIIEKIKRIWCILRNKEYCYFEICVDKEELSEFKEFVSKMKGVNDESSVLW